MRAQVKEQSLVTFTFKGLNCMNIGHCKGCVNTPGRLILNRVSLRSDENDNKSVLEVCNLIFTVEI